MGEFFDNGIDVVLVTPVLAGGIKVTIVKVDKMVLNANAWC
ncbi:hypothetical protein [Alteromonas gracilis]